MTALTQIERPRITEPAPLPPPAAARRGWIGGALSLLGVGVAVWWGVATYLGMVERISEFERVPIPGSQTITLEEGTQLLSVETGRLVSVPDIRFMVVGPNGRSVPITPYEGDIRYDVPDEPGRIGRAVATFEADARGDYSIEISGQRSSTAVVSVGGDAARAALPSILGALGLLSLSVLGGLFLAVRRMIVGRGGQGR
jgi:hypothetical protein